MLVRPPAPAWCLPAAALLKATSKELFPSQEPEMQGTLRNKIKLQTPVLHNIPEHSLHPNRYFYQLRFQQKSLQS